MEIRQKEIDITRREIEERLARVGDYVKMDFLQQCLKKKLDFDTRKFVLNTLSRIYEERKMYLEAGKLMRTAADINTTFEGKMQDFWKSSELFIRAGRFDESDISYGKALASGNETQKHALRQKIKQVYREQAKQSLAKDRRKHAAEAYEKLLSLDVDSMEKREIQQQLLKLYEQLGRVKDYYSMQRGM